MCAGLGRKEPTARSGGGAGDHCLQSVLHVGLGTVLTLPPLRPSLFLCPAWPAGSDPCLRQRSVLFLSRRCLCPVCAPTWLSSFVHTGEREKQKHFLLLPALLPPCWASGVPSGFIWGHTGASLGRSLECLPLWLAGFFRRKPCKEEGHSGWWGRGVREASLSPRA